MKKCMSLLLSVLLILTLVPMVASADVTESWQTFSYSMNGPEFSVNATDFAGSDSYKFYAAAYDGTGKLIDVKSTPATLSAGNLSASVNFEQDGKEADVSIAKVKTMLWKGITPVATNGTFNVTPSVYNSETGEYTSITNGFYEAYEPTEAYSIKYSQDGTWNFHNTTGSNGGNLYDRNANTNLGWGPTTINGLVYINLGETKEIDRVAVVSYEHNVRTAGIEFYVSTISPWIAGADRTAETAKAKFETYVDTTEGVSYVGVLETAAKTATSKGARVSFAVPAEGKNSQYVIAKFQESVCGGLIQELHAYKKKTASVSLASNRTETNVAEDAAAFAYGTAEGNDASLAVDGNANTAWTSLNDDSALVAESRVRDYLVLDLGTAYGITAFDINPATGVDQNFTIYGANAVAYDGTSKTGYTDKTALTAELSGLTAGQDNRVEANSSATKFRYIILEQAQASSTFGFNEVKVYSMDAEAASHVGPGAVELVSFGKSAVIYTNNAVNASSGGSWGTAANAAHMTNAIAADGNTSLKSSTNGAYAMVLFDLSSAQNLTHIAFQRYRKYSSEPSFDGSANFYIIASNNSNCKNMVDASGNKPYVELIDVTGTVEYYQTNGTQNTSYQDSGLVVFEIPQALRDNYQYFGVVTKTGTGSERMAPSTLQAYVRAE